MNARVQLLGSVQAWLGSESIAFLPDQRYQLLAYLAYQQEWVSRERLRYLFWADHPDKEAKDNLRQLLRRVRTLDLPDGLTIERQRLRWQVETDVRAFADALSQARWEDALEHYRGLFLSGLENGASEYSIWLGLERERLHNDWRRAVLKSAEAKTVESQHLEALTLLSDLLQSDDLDEEALERYMRLAHQVGGQDRALSAYEAFAGRLKEELSLEPTLRLKQLVQEIRMGTHAAAQVLDASSAQDTAPRRTTPLTNLPTQTSSFVGRDLELAEVAERLARPDCRLLTLTGLGGAGKTRVALRAAEQLAPLYPDGVLFVPLAPLRSPALIALALAERLDLSLSGQVDPVQQVADFVASKRLLLVLDNYEHLLAGADLAETLVGACPNLDLLVTSRERLNVEAEWLLLLGGLAYPQVGPLNPDALHFDAPRLFVARAEQVKPDFAVGSAELEYLLNICRLLEGSPLGLELAAAWVRVMPLADIATELGRSSGFLESRSRTKVERHRSLRTVFEHSWDLLTPAEQAALRRVSVFVGGFDREAGQRVAGVSLPVLAALVDKSLLRMNAEGRYSRHVLVYEYTREKLAERPHEQAQVEAAHGDYFMQRLVNQWNVQRGPDAQAAFTAIDQNFANVRAAWRWAAEGTHIAAIRQATFPLTLYFHRRMHYQEGLETFGHAAAALTERDPAHVGALAGVLTEQAWHAFRLGRSLEAKQLAEQALSLARSTGDNEVLMAALNALGCFAHHTGAYQAAQTHLQETLSLPESARLPLFRAELLNNIAMVEKALGHYDEVERHARDLLAFYQHHGNRVDAVFYDELMGELRLHQGELDEAERFIQEGLNKAKEHGASFITTRLLVLLARVAYGSGAYAEAQAHCHAALQLVQTRGGHSHEISDLKNTLGRLATARGDTDVAQDLLGQSLRYAWSIGALPRVLDALVYIAELYARQGRTLQAAELLSLAQHYSSSKYWLKNLAKQHLEGLEQRSLGGLAQARTRGEALALADLVPSLLAEWPRPTNPVGLKRGDP